jgi:hypothetical protein
MAYADKVAARLDGELAQGEGFRDMVRVARRGATTIAAALAGAGAVVGYLVATSGSDTSFVSAALGGGIGAGVGAAAGAAVAFLRGGGSLPTRNPYLVLARTDRRMLLMERSPLTNRPAAIAAEQPLHQVKGIDLGPRRLTFPRRAKISFADGTSWDLEMMVIDKPGEFAAS